MFFFFNDTATTEIYTLSLHDALPIYLGQVTVEQHDVVRRDPRLVEGLGAVVRDVDGDPLAAQPAGDRVGDPRLVLGQQNAHRSEEHTSELQSRQYLVCRLLLEKKK